MGRLLNKIKEPNDIKRISPKLYPILAQEIRDFLIDHVSQTGGHLASNLGAVEITMALHICLHFPEDKVVYDVGHQSYVHKILTGRMERFDTLRQYGGLSGFMKPEESITDPCITGHASDSVSVALGMALGAGASNRSFRVYAILGDGEIEEGQVWEAAMLAAHRKLDNLVVIVDNNGLQIDGNVADVNSPYPIDKKFEAFNFHVINVADGNDFDQLKAAFDEARTVTGMPTAIITKTVKGKGVSFMENQVGWHGKAPNDEEYAIAMAELEKAGEALCQK